MIGFAVQLSDLAGISSQKTVSPFGGATSGSGWRGATVDATPCFAFQRPAGPTRQVKPRAGALKQRGKFVQQPTGTNPREVACNAGIVS